MCAHHCIEVAVEPGTAEFHVHAFAMRIRDQHQAFVTRPHCVEKIDHVRVHANEMTHLFL